ncbi:MAG TPA: SH3 domain-containing protein [Kaistia sp.]|nr:SH3 domain-containing protein [Kaistia sp.]
MTPPGKSAALRLPPNEESADTGAAGFEAAIRNAAAARLRPRPQDTVRDKLLAFPGFEAARPAESASETAPDFGNELEAAMMSDLQSMVALFDEVASAPANAPTTPTAISLRQAPVEAPPAAEPDQEALDRLLASIRLSDRAPRHPAPAVQEPDLDDTTVLRGRRHEAVPAEVETPAEVAVPNGIVSRAAEAMTAALPKRNPRSPRPGGRDDRLASPLPRARKPVQSPAASPAVAPRIASKAEPVPALRLSIPGARRAYVKPALAVSLLILLATVGAGMTIRALTARNDTAPSQAATAAAADVPSATTAEAASPQAAAEPAPVTIAKTETQPLAAPPATESPSRVAVDNSAQHAIPAEMTQPTVMQATPMPPAVPLQPAGALVDVPATAPATNTTAPLSAAETVAAAEPVPSLPAPSDPVAAAPKAAASGGATDGLLKPGPGHITSGVKLRTNPDNGAPVIAVLGQGTGVQIVACKGWCEIVAGDKRGFVYQKFLSTAGG